MSYGGSGCTASNAGVTTDVQLPVGAQVEGIRLYYFDDAASGGVGLFFTTYDGIGGSNDLLNEASTLKVGYSSEYFALDSPYVFDGFTNAHVITATMNDEQYFCGARVFYTQ